VRSFGLSFVDPTLEKNVDVISFLIQLLFDQYDLISAPAIQFMIIWVLTYEMAVPSSVIYRTNAAIVDGPRCPVLRNLHGALFEFLGSHLRSCHPSFRRNRGWARTRRWVRCFQEFNDCLSMTVAINNLNTVVVVNRKRVKLRSGTPPDRNSMRH
jgi:hypothetical protein